MMRAKESQWKTKNNVLPKNRYSREGRVYLVCEPATLIIAARNPTVERQTQIKSVHALWSEPNVLRCVDKKVFSTEPELAL